MGRKGKNHRSSKAVEPPHVVEIRPDGIPADTDVNECAGLPPLEEHKTPLTESGSF
jgi:hypothetical protein